jgi:hypothetical protein
MMSDPNIDLSKTLNWKALGAVLLLSYSTAINPLAAEFTQSNAAKTETSVKVVEFENRIYKVQEKLPIKLNLFRCQNKPYPLNIDSNSYAFDYI